MILAVLPQHRSQYVDLLAAMHRLRFRVFHQRLGWEVTTVGDLEIDDYDAMAPIYLLQLDRAGEVKGCARLLCSTGPTMLSRTFPSLLGSSPCPEHPLTWESSRFAVEAGQDRRSPGIGQATIELFAGLLELGLHFGWREVLTVTDLRLERVGVRAGLEFQRFAEPQQIGRTQAVAGSGRVSVATLRRIQTVGGLAGPVLQVSSDIVRPGLAA
ncbi:GNAT family N-acetyltransferase [Sphingomonas ginkgonis]|uniref:Acyl-homoserine-lactone synthase n=1 Tax=Sphingomonas ginkgonis TaxID=2315330 RepID=A0A3S0EN37_9SPHN|nr:acyl-homoserine-lactone synthase [Sphingomonas ginkgonis]RST31337.1 GNAT family N-acetyltransferase [Sphingomonas ginkgonis]